MEVFKKWVSKRSLRLKVTPFQDNLKVVLELSSTKQNIHVVDIALSSH